MRHRNLVRDRENKVTQKNCCSIWDQTLLTIYLLMTNWFKCTIKILKINSNKIKIQVFKGKALVREKII